MEKESASANPIEQEVYQLMISAQQGDKKSMEKIINYFISDIKYFAKWTGMNKDDAIQSIIADFIEFIKRTDFDGIL